MNDWYRVPGIYSKFLLQGMMCILMPVIILLVIYYNGDGIFLFVSGFLCLSMVIINVKTHYDLLGELDFFSPGVAFPAAYISIIGIALASFSMEIGYSYNAEVTSKDIFYYLVGLLCYAWGNIFASSLYTRKSKFLYKGVVNTWSKRELLKWGSVIVVVGSIGTFIYYSKMGVPLFGNVDEIRHGFQGRLYGIGFSFPLLQGLNFVLLVYLIYRYSKKLFAVRMLVPILWILLLTALTGYRWLCILFIAVPLTGYNYIVGRFKFNLKTVGAIVILAIIILSFHGLLGYQRSITKRTESEHLRNLESMNIPSEFKYFAPVLFSLQHPSVSFSKLINLVPDEYDYFYGKYALAQVPIIQRIFPSLSQENVGVYITDTIFGYDYRAGSGGTAMSIIGSLYIDFGPLAIIVGMAIIGFFLEITYLRAAETPSLLNITVYSFLLWTVIKWIVAGVCVGDLLVLLMILAIDKLIRKKKSSVY